MFKNVFALSDELMFNVVLDVQYIYKQVLMMIIFLVSLVCSE